MTQHRHPREYLTPAEGGYPSTPISQGKSLSPEMKMWLTELGNKLEASVRETRPWAKQEE